MWTTKKKFYTYEVFPSSSAAGFDLTLNPELSSET